MVRYEQDLNRWFPAETDEKGRTGGRKGIMTWTMYFNMLLNIGLLVLLATLLTNMPAVRKLFRGENNTTIQKMALAVIFGAISIVSTYTGTRTGGAIVNTRVIGVLTAGIMGGPFVGMMTAVIAGAHRFLFDIGGFTAVSCAVSTLVEGVLGSLAYKRYKAGEMDSVDLLFLTAEAEILQMDDHSPDIETILCCYAAGKPDRGADDRHEFYRNGDLF